MEIKETLNVPVKYLWHNILKSVLYDARKETGKPLTETQLTGLKYTKTFSNHQQATLQILTVEPEQEYAYTTTTTRNAYTVRYVLTPAGDGKTTVVYTEKIDSNGGLQKANDFITSILLGWQRKRGFKKMLKQMEETYQQA